MTYPTIFPAKYTGTRTDFLINKENRAGSVQVEKLVVSVASGTATGVNVGLVPFHRGATLVDVKLANGALGTGVTGSVGVIYEDNVANADNATLFADAASLAAAGQSNVDIKAAGLTWVAPANGWIVIQTAGAATGTAGTVTASVCLSYDR